jgi:hypothetical protein
MLEKYGTERYLASKDKAEKTIKTSLEKYGVDHPTKSDKIKAKAKKTCLEKYGVDHHMKSDEVKTKVRETTLSKYGVDNAAKANVIKEKIQKTNLLRYGVTSSLARKEIRDIRNSKVRQDAIKERKNSEHILATISHIEEDNLYTVLEIRPKIDDPDVIEYVIKCESCKEVFLWDEFIYTYKRVEHNPYCKNCIGHFSKEEKRLLNFVKSIYDGPILENDRNVIKPYELDIYLPDLAIAIEYNGTYWHSFKGTCSFTDFLKSSEQKRLLCHEAGIRLVTIDECDYLRDKGVFQRFLTDLIVPRRRVFARNCVVKRINKRIARDFCQYYHVNGFRGGREAFGLYDHEELLIVAVFSLRPKGWECVRLCYKTGIDVIGGWAKIRKRFGKPFLHYINLKYFDGENKTGCGYRFVVKNGKVLHRNSLQRNTNLYKYCDIVDPSLSDFQNCINNRLLCVPDLGNDIRNYTV